MSQDTELASEADRLLQGFDLTPRAARLVNTFQMVHEQGHGYRLYKGCARLATVSTLADFLTLLVASANRLALGRCKMFAVHSAVVSLDNRVVAMPADSGGGKTTLATACLLAGYAYLSDEALALDDDGLVLKYPKPLALSPSSCRLLGLEPNEAERLVIPSEIDAEVDHERRPLTDIVIARYGTDRARMEPIHRSHAVTALLSRSFNHYKNPERAFRIATEVARSVRVWRLDYGHPVEGATLLRDRLS